MSHIELVCVECGASHEADMIALSCQSCGSPLDVGYRDADAAHHDVRQTSGCPCLFTQTPPQ